jgi:Protein of unknown function (DUF2582).
MITKIGIVAGEIWHYLDQHGESRLRVMLKGIDRPRDLILMSLGWLAREGHIILKEEASEFIIVLRKTGSL